MFRAEKLCNIIFEIALNFPLFRRQEITNVQAGLALIG